jgi:hypothetical protein
LSEVGGMEAAPGLPLGAKHCPPKIYQHVATVTGRSGILVCHDHTPTRCSMQPTTLAQERRPPPRPRGLTPLGQQLELPWRRIYCMQHWHTHPTRHQYRSGGGTIPRQVVGAHQPLVCRPRRRRCRHGANHAPRLHYRCWPPDYCCRPPPCRRPGCIAARPPRPERARPSPQSAGHPQSPAAGGLPPCSRAVSSAPAPCGAIRWHDAASNTPPPCSRLSRTASSRWQCQRPHSASHAASATLLTPLTALKGARIPCCTAIPCSDAIL